MFNMRQTIVTEREVYPQLFEDHSIISNPMFKDLVDAGLQTTDLGMLTTEFLLGTWFDSHVLHQWMITNSAASKLQFEDGRCVVSVHSFTDLKETCQKVLLVPGLAETLMPAQVGSSYDQTYADELTGIVNVIKVIEKFPSTWTHRYVVESL